MFFQAMCRSWLAMISLCLLLGCGGGGDTVKVTGTVLFDGQPVEQGDIIFRAADGSAADAAKIEGGLYHLETKPGSKRVEINATRESATPAPDGLPTLENYIPKQYNQASTLTAEVTDSGKNDFSFELKSDGS